MESRTRNVAKNINFSLIFQIGNIIAKFFLRTVFIYCLGKEYLGVNGVFVNILSVLSITELGLGSAIIYDMYRPIAENDYDQINRLFWFYKKVYSVIGIVILCIGLILIPWLKYIIHDVPGVEHLYVIYILQLVTSCSTYFFAHYRSLFTAYQLESENTKTSIIFLLFKVIGQAIVLVLWRNYFLFLIVDLVITILLNIFIAQKARNNFLFITKKIGNITKFTQNNIINNAASTFSMKIGATILNATDNILISALISTITAGLYSNYALIISVITASTMMISHSLQASVGNLCVSANYEKKREIFDRIRFIYVTIYYYVFVILINVLNQFILSWIGEEYELSIEIVIWISLNCYLTGVRQPIEIFIYADGLFPYFKIKPWIEALINFVISFLFARVFGIVGILFGTTISHLTTSLWYDSYILYKYSIHERWIIFWKKYVNYFIPALVASILIYYLNGHYMNYLSRIENLLCSFIVTLSVSTIIWILCFWKNVNFIYYRKTFYRILRTFCK